jgi:hypothetical protein
VTTITDQQQTAIDSIISKAINDIRDQVKADYGEDARVPGEGEYDLYIEELPTKTGSILCAVVDVGEWYTQSFYWLDDEWVIHPDDPHSLREHIIKYRLLRSRF